jgi:2-oxo-3-hexenedioate decarboxylase
MLDDDTCHALARRLEEARLERKEIEPLLKMQRFDLEDAYRIQRAGIGLRVRRGEAVAGYKMGLTSAAKRAQMNLDAPIYGVLTDAMRIEDGGRFLRSRAIHPKIEPEIAFVLGRDVCEPLTRDEALESIASVAAAMDILDSRYVGFKYFSLPDVVADNASSLRFVLSDDARVPGNLDLAHLKMRFFVDGELKYEAESSAISGDPVVSLVELSRMLHAHGQELPAGSLVLAGAATPAEALTPGKVVRLEVTGLAPVSVRSVE